MIPHQIEPGRWDQGGAETAARESAEETRGYFKRGDLLPKIKKSQPVTDDYGFVFYFVEVDFAPVQRIANHVPPDDRPDYTERRPYAWIPYSSVEPYLLQPVKKEKRYVVDKLYLPPPSANRMVLECLAGQHAPSRGAALDTALVHSTFTAPLWPPRCGAKTAASTGRYNA